MAGDRTRIDCLEGNHADHYTTIAGLQEKWLNVYSCHNSFSPFILFYSRDASGDLPTTLRRPVSLKTSTLSINYLKSTLRHWKFN